MRAAENLGRFKMRHHRLEERRQPSLRQLHNTDTTLRGLTCGGPSGRRMTHTHVRRAQIRCKNGPLAGADGANGSRLYDHE